MRPRIVGRMSYIRFVLSHPRILAFGVLLTLFSSFGQTFLISIFVPRMIDEMGLTTGGFGTLYSVATVLSASCLPFFGRILDRVSVRSYTIGVAFALMLACGMVSISVNAPMLFVGIVGLRLAGQGLLGLTASTTMARCFPENKGKALSVSAMGYPLGEGLLPMLAVLMIASYGWRVSWQIMGGLVAVLLLPLIVALVRNLPNHEGGRSCSSGQRENMSEVLRDPRFYQLLPGLLVVPFVLTGLFLYQLPLAGFKGWTDRAMAVGFIGFAGARLVSSILVGPLIDRVGSLRLIPLTLIPVMAGLVFLFKIEGEWGATVFLVLMGAGQGPAGTISTAVWVDLYGIDALGRIKSLVAMLGVFSTAFSPILIGFMLQIGVGFEYLIPAFGVVNALAFGLSYWSSRRIIRAMRSAQHS